MMLQADLEQRRATCLQEIDILMREAACVRDPSQREFMILVRQARIIELGAIETYMGLPRTIQPKRKRAESSPV